MKILTARQMRTIDRRATERYGVAGLVLMRVLSVIEREASPGTLALTRRNGPLALPRQAANV